MEETWIKGNGRELRGETTTDAQGIYSDCNVKRQNKIHLWEGHPFLPSSHSQLGTAGLPAEEKLKAKPSARAKDQIRETASSLLDSLSLSLTKQ
jgi:hypothetical protein